MAQPPREVVVFNEEQWHLGVSGHGGGGLMVGLDLNVFSSLCDSKHTALNDLLCPFDMLCKTKHLPEERSDCRSLQITAPY